MEFKGTRGKWEVCKNIHTNEMTIYPLDTTVAICDREYTDKTAEANAQLIAHAPEMLEMLIEILTSDFPVTNDRINDLLTRATTI